MRCKEIGDRNAPEEGLWCSPTSSPSMPAFTVARRGKPTDHQPLSARLWAGVDDIYAAILAHPFIAGLTDGSLEREAFRFYVVQDAHYLSEYARALSVAAARAPTESDIAMFSEHAAGAIAVERSLHESFFAHFGMSEEEVAATPTRRPTWPTPATCWPSPTAARFPRRSARCCPATGSTGRWARRCFSVDRPTRYISAGSRPTAGEEFAAVVRAVLALTDRLGPQLAPAEEARMHERTSRYEWMFWEMGYRREPWPVGSRS
jgi:thiaminase (transcriptional activator TenA)